MKGPDRRKWGAPVDTEQAAHASDAAQRDADEVVERLYRRQWSAVVNYVRFRLGPSDAEDIAADAFVKAWVQRNTLDTRRGAPESWLWTIVRNATVDAHRRGATRSARSTAADPPPSNVDERVLKQADLERAVEAMTRLKDIDREIIALRFGAGLTNAEIGAQLGRKKGNVALRLHRAFRQLRRELERSNE